MNKKLMQGKVGMQNQKTNYLRLFGYKEHVGKHG